MKKFSDISGRTFPLIKNMLLPATILLMANLIFYGFPQIGRAGQLFFHFSFYTLVLLILRELIHHNHGKPLFFVLVIILNYAVINQLKIDNPSDFSETPLFLNLSFFTPIYLGIFAFLPERKFFKRINVWLLLLFFIQFAVIEHLSRQNISLAKYFYITESNLAPSSQILFFALLFVLFVRTVISGRLQDYTLFFASLEILMALYDASSASALTIFYTASLLSIFMMIIYEAILGSRIDKLTGVGSRKAFLIDEQNFPIKYSLGIISIDNYANLKLILGHRRLNNLVRMIANIIEEKEPDELLYRYKKDEFVIILNVTEDRKASYKRLENIRRVVAGSLFKLSHNKNPIKITVSCAYSDKKRSDSGIYEVLSRVHKELHKRQSFNQNMTTVA